MAVWCVAFLAIGTIAPAAEPEAESKRKDRDEVEFIRLVRDQSDMPVSMEVAIVRYTPRGDRRGKPTVDLIGAVHIGEKSYYEQLNREFRKYDAVLYELVAPEGTKVPKGGGTSNHPVSMLQNGMKSILKLEFQLSEIDYGRENMVHADMTPEQFAKSMKQRGETMFTMFLRMMSHAMMQQQSSKVSDTQLLLALFQKDRALALKRVLAEQFQDMGGSFAALEGPNGSTLISGRNGVALKVLREQLDQGKRKIAIFYGAGHMDDFRKRLEKDFDLVPGRTRWLVAWDLSSPKDADSKPAVAEEGNATEDNATEDNATEGKVNKRP
ncbi:MAG: hypothetical protein V3R99_09920 [Thermoguttaceae bacterium]